MINGVLAVHELPGAGRLHPRLSHCRVVAILEVVEGGDRHRLRHGLAWSYGSQCVLEAEEGAEIARVAVRGDADEGAFDGGSVQKPALFVGGGQADRVGAVA
jgi:hypothetical protein